MFVGISKCKGSTEDSTIFVVYKTAEGHVVVCRRIAVGDSLVIRRNGQSFLVDRQLCVRDSHIIVRIITQSYRDRILADVIAFGSRQRVVDGVCSDCAIGGSSQRRIIFAISLGLAGGSNRCRFLADGQFCIRDSHVIVRIITQSYRDCILADVIAFGSRQRVVDDVCSDCAIGGSSQRRIIFAIGLGLCDGSNRCRFLADGVGHARRSVTQRDVGGVGSGIRGSGAQNSIALLIDDGRSIDPFNGIDNGCFGAFGSAIDDQRRSHDCKRCRIIRHTADARSVAGRGDNRAVCTKAPLMAVVIGTDNCFNAAGGCVMIFICGISLTEGVRRILRKSGKGGAGLPFAVAALIFAVCNRIQRYAV